MGIREIAASEGAGAGEEGVSVWGGHGGGQFYRRDGGWGKGQVSRPAPTETGEGDGTSPGPSFVRRGMGWGGIAALSRRYEVP